jgi:hypothetical protein
LPATVGTGLCLTITEAVWAMGGVKFVHVLFLINLKPDETCTNFVMVPYVIPIKDIHYLITGLDKADLLIEMLLNHLLVLVLVWLSDRYKANPNPSCCPLQPPPRTSRT